MSAEIELYQDAAEEWRWRLRHENGNILADSGEGYATRSGVTAAIERIKDHGAEAQPLDISVSTFEVFEAADGEWRWRLRHRNGEILADSGEGYASRSKAIDAIRRVKRHAQGAPAEED